MHMHNIIPECLSLITPHQTNLYPVSCSAVSSCQQQLLHHSNMFMLNSIHQSCEPLLHDTQQTVNTFPLHSVVFDMVSSSQYKDEDAVQREVLPTWESLNLNSSYWGERERAPH